MLFKIKAVPSLEVWRDCVYDWRYANCDSDFLQEVAERIIQHSIWLKIAKLLDCQRMIEERNIDFNAPLTEDELDRMYERDRDAMCLD